MLVMAKNISVIDLNVGYNDKPIPNISNLKLLGLVIDNTLSWKTHVDMIILK
jgi:hypothetical protein